MTGRKIGILALQGDFAKHDAMLKSLHVDTLLVKKAKELDGCDGLVIPGGESTTLTKLMRLYGMYEPIREFSLTRPIMGTCAGMIMLASQVDDERITPLQLIDISVKRNAYGRQIDSFISEVKLPFLANDSSFRAIFIRAPQITAVGSDVEILLELDKKPVMVRNRNIFALAFHPELTDDSRIHRYFLENFSA
ncbi:MAG: glutamine amidotransferase subunit PdxT [Desulfobacteraceae bacterium IS3]|nr:MAG: glutamine amidotransferase subunit PdxT [Desulfobacteraceae bacterium IS3]